MSAPARPLEAGAPPPAGEEIAQRPEGSVSTWILLRGLTRESRHWGEFPALLRSALPAAEVVAPDLPGNGRLHALASPASIPGLLRHCRGEIAASGQRPPYYLLAMSLGAMVAVAWAEQYPAELAGCVLINTSLRPFSPFWQRLRPGRYADLLAVALASDDAARETIILDLTSRHLPAHAALVEQWAAYRHEHPVSGLNALRQLLAAARYRAPASRPASPMLVLASRGDRLVDIRCSRQITRQWRCRLAEHPTAGHDLPLDDGCWVAAQVRDWLREIGAGSEKTA